MKIESYYVIGNGIEYFSSLEEAEKNYDNFPEDNKWKALGVEFIDFNSRCNPCGVDILITSKGKERISKDYERSGYKLLFLPIVEQIKTLRNL